MEIKPYLTLGKNYSDALTFYKEAFNAKEEYAIFPNETTLKIGHSFLHLSNEKTIQNISFIFEGNKQEIEHAFIALKKEGSIKLDLDISSDHPKKAIVTDRFGVTWIMMIKEKVVPEKAKQAGKPRHKWTKEVSNIKFYANNKQASGTVIWRKSKELVLLSGATMSPTAQLNQDGSKNYSAIVAEKIRDDQKDYYKDLTTTEDIVFPSPHVLGMFLFYGGQDTWKELIDENGKSLNDWSVVK